MRYYKIFLLSVFLSTINYFLVINVNAEFADASYDDKSWPSCVVSGECFQVCGYTNLVSTGLSRELGRSAYVYYSYDTNSFFVYLIGNIETFSGKNKINDVIYSINDEKVLYNGGNISYILNNGVCPQKAYIDITGTAYKICFDDDGSYCLKHKGLGTSKLEYNYQDDLKGRLYAYFDKTYKYSDFNYEKKYLDVINTDLSKSLSHFTNLPKFVFNDDIISSIFKDAIVSFASTCAVEVDKATNLTADEKKEILAGLNYSNSELNSVLSNIQNVLNNNKPDDNNPNDVDVECSDLLLPDVQVLLTNILNIMKFAGPILVIIFTTIDLIKASVSGDSGEMKKVSSKFIKRAIAAVLLFFIPILIGFILDLFGIVAPNCVI